MHDVTARQVPLVHTIRFGPLSIAYDHRVLEPRPWTLLQSEWAAELLATAPPGPVLELCTGVGHIGLAAIEASGRSLVAVDRSAVACRYAEENARAAGLADRVDVRQADLQEALEPAERFPLVIADPPWVHSHLVEGFPDDPVGAIDGGSDGLDLARTCVRVIAAHLAPGGSALLQVGSPEQVRTLAGELPAQLVAGPVREEPGRGAVVQLLHRE